MARRPKLAIIGDQNRKAKDQPLIDEAEKEFHTVYIPITEMRLGLSSKSTVTADGKDLSKFDCVLLVPTAGYREMFYTIARMLAGKTKPFNHEQYLLSINDDVLFKYMNRFGVKTRQSMFICSSHSLPAAVSGIKFPAIVRFGVRRVSVTNMRTLKDIISFSPRGTPIKIETPVRAKNIVWVFVVGNEVVGGYEIKGKELKPFNVGEDMKRAAIGARSALNCDYCGLRFIIDRSDDCVLDRLTFSPDFAKFQKVTSKNIARYVISDIKRKTEESEWWVAKEIREVVKKIPRTARKRAVKKSKTRKSKARRGYRSRRR